MPKAKSAAVKSGHQTKAEKAARLDAEEQLRGDAVDTLEPPEYLNDRQRQIFREVFALLKPTKILNAGDVYMLTNLAISIERKECMDDMINGKPELMARANFMASRERYEKSYLRCCAELCLSPAARAKMGLMAAQGKADADDPLATAMNGGADK